MRQRGPMFKAVIRALKHAQIEVAGADRLVLTEHIAIMDLLVLGDALLLADDDLALATVLKSPLFGLDDEQLYKLAYKRKGSLRSGLRAKGSEDAAYGVAASALDVLSQKAHTSSPFEFYAHVLGAHKGRARILSRLGTEASDPLDEFLNLALFVRTTRNTVATRFSQLDSRGAERSQARHGDGARRGARDDCARRQGP